MARIGFPGLIMAEPNQELVAYGPKKSPERTINERPPRTGRVLEHAFHVNANRSLPGNRFLVGALIHEWPGIRPEVVHIARENEPRAVLDGRINGIREHRHGQRPPLEITRRIRAMENHVNATCGGHHIIPVLRITRDPLDIFDAHRMDPRHLGVSVQCTHLPTVGLQSFRHSGPQ